MPFKEDASFLRFVTMGAIGAQKAKATLEQADHEIIELERSSCSNKIWYTKIKRLRVPDLLCVRCGRRFEVRAKSKLEVKMSHSPTNADRHWDSAMHDDDIVIFIACYDDGGGVRAADTLNALSVADLRATRNRARLGPPKSASEGAERDLTWPSWVPGRDGVVPAVTGSAATEDARVKVEYDDGRRYTYRAADKAVFPRVGERFRGAEQIVATIVANRAPLRCPGMTWEPNLSNELGEGDLYTSVKALTRRAADEHIARLQELLDHEDPRIALEAAGVLVRRGQESGLRHLVTIAEGEDDDAPWAMEAVFILAESGVAEAGACLAHCATVAPHDEVRAAAVWGLKRFPAQADAVLSAFNDDDEGVRLHAIAVAADHIRGANDTTRLLALLDRDPMTAASACESLVRSGQTADAVLIEAAAGEGPIALWAFSVLSRRSPGTVMDSPAWLRLSDQLRASLRNAWHWRENSWLAAPEAVKSLEFLEQQQI